MSREIKFRAWDGKTVFPINNGPVSVTMGQLGFPVYDGEGRIIDCDLMQFTGLLDKNGVEIYEGDVLGSYEDEEILPLVISFDADQNGWMAYDGFNDFSGFDFSCLCREFEVIGNIYENPELLK